MKKKQIETKKRNVLALRKETLLPLENRELRRVAGAGVLRPPIGFSPDTTPIYGDTTG